jgi:hypothetical protein
LRLTRVLSVQIELQQRFNLNRESDPYQTATIHELALLAKQAMQK